MWSNQSAAGIEYLSGNLGSGRLLLFRNGFKKTERDPDWILYLAPRSKKEDAGQGEEPSDDSGIPF